MTYELDIMCYGETWLELLDKKIVMSHIDWERGKGNVYNVQPIESLIILN